MQAKVISVFNHKGGVSKTTSTYNIGWKLANMGYKILLLDGDPQCNLTGLILKDNFEDYYEGNMSHHNIKDAVKPAFEGTPKPIEAIDCYSPIENKNLFLIPGHMDLSEYDPALSLALNSNNAISTLQNLPGSFYELIRLCCEKYAIDYVFIDMNPGLSAINQTFFVSSDGFIVPTNPDPFSIMALKTMEKVLPKWKNWAIHSQEYLKSAAYPLPIKEMRFIGQIIQRFNLRNNKPAAAYQDKIEDIQNFIKDYFSKTMQKYNMIYETSHLLPIYRDSPYCLGFISEFGALLQRSHEAGVPVFALDSQQLKATGSVLDQMKTRQEDFDSIFSKIAEAIIEITNE